MGEWADAFDSLFDRFGDDRDDDDDSYGETACKYCGLPGLMWQQTKRGWRLTDIHGIIHLCAERPMSKHAESLKATLEFPGFKK